MNNDCQSRLAEASKMLTEAQNLNANVKHGSAMKLAYEASEYIASGYLAGVTGNSLPPCDATYDVFANTIRAQNYDPALMVRIGELVGKVSALREIYEPALLDETTAKDAQQTVDWVIALHKLVGMIVQ